MDRLCVYCGSRTGGDPAYRETAETLGGLLADRGVGLVYGGGSVGLMGVLADATLDAGGEAYGVIPEPLTRREGRPEGLTELRVVGSMHERKREMADLADGFLALPGGLGTMEELFEIVTWSQLGIHADPCGLLNVAGYYDDLVRFLDGQVDAGFVDAVDRRRLLVDDDPAALLDRFDGYDAPETESWITEDET